MSTNELLALSTMALAIGVSKMIDDATKPANELCSGDKVWFDGEVQEVLRVDRVPRRVKVSFSEIGEAVLLPPESRLRLVAAS